MKKEVRIKSMKIANFKGVSNLEVEFGYRTLVTGGNGTGKSSLYAAYLWCLFGKNYLGQAISVQPLDSSNNVIHKVDTSVEMILSVDGNDVIVKRIQREDWSVPRGTSQEVLKGNVQERFYNEVPCGVSEFSEKLNSICPIDDWFMLSSISAFMNLKQEDRRKKLQSISEIVSDDVIAAHFPVVQEALKSGKTIDELKRQVALSKSKSKTELEQIPARIDQQEKLRVSGIDFAAAKKRVAEIDKEIQGLDNRMQANVSNDDLEAMTKALANRNYILSDISDLENSLKKERDKRVSEISSQISTHKTDIERFERDKLSLESELKSIEPINETFSREFVEARESWLKENSTKFEQSDNYICSECHQSYPQEMVDELASKAVANFNSRKLSNLKKLVEEAERCKLHLESNTKRISEVKSKLETLNTNIEIAKKAKGELESQLEKVPELSLAIAASKEHTKLKDDLVEADKKITLLRNNKPQQTADNSLSVIKESLNKEKDNLLKELSQEGVNERIDKFKLELEQKATDLAQAVADADKIEFEIQAFKKRKIELVEASVSSLFEFVKWKMYEPNITNDGEKEICQAVIDGKPYEQQNTATMVNAGIDIINGLSVASNVYVPLFVDNKESVSELIETNAQLITLEVVKGAQLSINKF